MKEFKQPKLKGIEDLGDPRYSLATLTSSENIKEYIKSDNFKISSKLGGKVAGQKNVESGHLIQLAKKLKKTGHYKKLGKLHGGKAFNRIWKENPEQLIQACIKGGKVAGQKNVESGHMYKIQKQGCFLGGKATAKKYRKLTFEQAQEIRQLYATGEYSQRVLAKKYKVTRGIVVKIIKNESYKKT